MTDVDNVMLEEPEFHVILTDRLRLRTLRVADAELMMPILSREEIMTWTVSMRQGVITNVDIF